MMKNIKYIALLLIFLISAISYGQDCGGDPCPPGWSCDLVHGNYVCVRPGGGPPPPGLVVPIDSKVIFLLISGLGLGVYFLTSTKKRAEN